MNKNSFKKIGIVIGVLVLLGGGFAATQYFMPHRDVQSVEAFVNIEATTFVDEYLADNKIANDKYLDAEGESKVIAISGVIKSIDKDQKNQFVVVLKSNNPELGVSCTFMESTNKHAETLKIGDSVNIKGVIRSGAEYDEDLDLYEDAIIEKCDIVK